MPDDIITIEHLKKYFHSGRFGTGLTVRAVDDVNFSIHNGEILGIVGESGSGKTTLGRTILRFEKPTGGKILYYGVDENNKAEFCRKMQMIFQDSYLALDPRMTVFNIVGEPLDIHRLYSGKPERKERITELLNSVGLNSAYAERYPHELSGGQRQRVVIARALAMHPEFLVCDEPVSALDASIQAQIILLLKELQQKSKTTCLFIAHDLAVVKHLCDRVGVMYLGSFVELSETGELFSNTLHPYTRMLISSMSSQKCGAAVQNKTPDSDDFLLSGRTSGCKFKTQCPIAREICSAEAPAFTEVYPGHYCACHFAK